MGDSKHPSLPLARAERKPFDRKRKNCPAPPAREPAQRKNQLCLWPARSAKPFDQKKKPAPRHQRVKPLPSASLNKRPKQPLLCRVCVAEPLRVPLDAEAEVRVRLFQRFYNAVLAEGGYF